MSTVSNLDDRQRRFSVALATLAADMDLSFEDTALVFGSIIRGMVDYGVERRGADMEATAAYYCHLFEHGFNDTLPVPFGSTRN